ncbi:MAG: hypothetical protein K2X27_11885 [Candidatus Obscuribacterales bacterium]|nr:hypothetical protein [Candidatus Obscuribacterales bacterium]
MCSFSSANKALIISLFSGALQLNCLGLQAQTISDDQTSRNPSAANFANDVSLNDSIKIDKPLAPALPDRSLRPAPAAVPLPTFNSISGAKASLAWRQKALKLSLEKFKDAEEAAAASAMLRYYAASFTDTLMALAASCAALNFKVLSINSNAGELLAESSDGGSRLIFSVWEQVEGKTWINAGIDRGPGASTSKAAAMILDTTAGTISKRGRI